MFGSIKSKILISQIGLILLVSFVLGMSNFFIVTRHFKEIEKETLSKTAEYEAKILQKYLLNTKERMQRISQSRNVRLYAETFAEHPLIEYFAKFKNTFPVLTYVDKDGDEDVKVIRGNLSPQLQDLSETEIFRNAMQNRNNVVSAFTEYCHELEEPAITYAMARYNYFDEFIGVIVGSVPLSAATHQISKLRIGKTGFACLINKEGLILAGPQKDKNLTKLVIGGRNTRNANQISDLIDQKTRLTRVTILGIDGYMASASVKYQTWSVIVVLPYSEFMEIPNKIRNTSVLIFFVIFSVGAIIALRLSKGITNPLEKVIAATAVISKGDLSQRVSIESREDEVGKLGVSFNRMIEDLSQSRNELLIAKKTAESSSQAKSDFLAGMSHELRTPLNHIIGFTELVADKKFGDLNKTQVEYLNDVLQSAHHLLSLINDILDLSKVETGKMRLETEDINMRILLENSLNMVKEKAMKHGIELSMAVKEIPETIAADERKVKQIMYNLLSNAVKFVPDGGQVSVSAQMVDYITRPRLRYGDSQDLPIIEDPIERSEVAGTKRKKFVEICISDTGIGIRPEDQMRIFDPFEQADGSTSRRHQGTGLGLSLTKSLVELHGGRIWVESEGEGKGSSFRFVIPV